MTPATATGDPIYIKPTQGYGVEPCPGCGGQLKPGQARVTVPGIWRVWHADCFPCPHCDDVHLPPYDGGCLL